MHTTAGRRITQNDCATSAHRNLSQLPIGEEREPLSIRRKHRHERIVGARERRRLELIEAADVDLARSSPASGR